MLSRIDHVNIVVQDMEKMVAFYSAMLGMTVTKRVTISGDWVSAVTGLKDVHADVAYLECVVQQRPPSLGDNAVNSVSDRLLNAEDLPTLLHDLVRIQAVEVKGTEAAAFAIEESAPRLRLRACVHIRPDDSTARTRMQALLAFEELVEPCIAQDRDGTIEIPGSAAEHPQFCLVTRLSQDGVVVGASAVITRCPDQDEALQRLGTMQRLANYFGALSRHVEASQTGRPKLTRIELIQYHTPVATRPLDQDRPNAAGLRHLAFAVTDIELLVESLRNRGVKFFSDVVTVPDSQVTYAGGVRKRIVYFQDPERNLLELCEYR